MPRSSPCWTDGVDRLRLIASATGVTAVEQQHRDDHGAVNDLLAEFGDLHNRQDRLQQRDQDDAGDGADIFSPTAEDRGAAEHHRRDRGQKIGVAHRLRRLTGIARQHFAAKRRKPARQRKGQEHYALGCGAESMQQGTGLRMR
jgi:hypothetical protein